MEEKIIKSLIELYRSKGIDVTALINDPAFNSLSFDTRVSMIKKYADDLASDASTVVTKKDIKNFIRDAAIGAGLGAAGGLIGSFQAGSIVDDVGPKTMMKAIFGSTGRSTAVGAGLGMVSSGLRTASKIRARQEMHEQALKLKADPSDENAIKMISLRYMQPTGFTRTDLLARMYDKYDSRYVKEVMNSRENAGSQVLDELSDYPLKDDPHSVAIKNRLTGKND